MGCPCRLPGAGTGAWIRVSHGAAHPFTADMAFDREAAWGVIQFSATSSPMRRNWQPGAGGRVGFVVNLGARQMGRQRLAFGLAFGWRMAAWTTAPARFPSPPDRYRSFPRTAGATAPPGQCSRLDRAKAPALVQRQFVEIQLIPIITGARLRSLSLSMASCQSAKRSQPPLVPPAAAPVGAVHRH